MTYEMARALCDAGYLSVSEYILICRESGWLEQISVDTCE